MQVYDGISDSELNAIKSLLRAILDSERFTKPGELHARTGFYREQVSDLLDAWPSGSVEEAQAVCAVLSGAAWTKTSSSERWRVELAQDDVRRLHDRIDANLKLSAGSSKDASRRHSEPDIESYLEGLGPDRRSRMVAVRSVIQRHSSLDERISHGSLTYLGPGKAPFITLAPRDEHVSLIPHIGESQVALLKGKGLGDEVAFSRHAVRIFRITAALESALQVLVSDATVERFTNSG